VKLRQALYYLITVIHVLKTVLDSCQALCYNILSYFPVISDMEG